MSLPVAAGVATASVVSDGPAAGCRAIDLRVEDGLDLRVLPDRGLDLGAAWYRGMPVAWTSAIGETGPLSTPQGDDWLSAFGGGLMTTCGLRNVGSASEGHGVHGAFSHQRAFEVAVERRTLAGGHVELAVGGVIREASAFGAVLEVRREITTRTGSGRVTVRDVARNLGPEPEAAPLLYHFNIGAPLWAPGARVDVDGGGPTPAPAVGDEERVSEHAPVADANGWARVVLDHGALDRRLTVRWRVDELPRLHRWIHPAPGVGVLGIEPANCSLAGRAADRESGSLPVLAPGEERHTEIEVTIAPLGGSGAS